MRQVRLAAKAGHEVGQVVKQPSHPSLSTSCIIPAAQTILRGLSLRCRKD
jgi:hypothetical protein